jgi:hypothetical protein
MGAVVLGGRSFGHALALPVAARPRAPCKSVIGRAASGRRAGSEEQGPAGRHESNREARGPQWLILYSGPAPAYVSHAQHPRGQAPAGVLHGRAAQGARGMGEHGGATNMLIEALPRNVNVVQAQSLPRARAAQTTPERAQRPRLCRPPAASLQGASHSALASVSYSPCWPPGEPLQRAPATRCAGRLAA